MMSTLTSLDHTVMALFFQKLTFARPFMTFRNSEIVIFIKWYHASTFIFGEKGMKIYFAIRRFSLFLENSVLLLNILTDLV